jgi:hypothetical protein
MIQYLCGGRGNVAQAMFHGNGRRNMRFLNRPLPAPTLATRLLAVALFFTVYFYVPTVRSCELGLTWFDNGGLLDAYCLEPVFRVPCVASSRYHRPQEEGDFLCRTWWHRPVRIIDKPKYERILCESTLGWLANYEPGRGCFCDYHSTEQHGVCVMTDEACRDLFGSGATVRIDEKLGYADQCDWRGRIQRPAE